MSTPNKATVEPEIPDELKGKKPIALTYDAARDGDGEADDNLTDGGQSQQEPISGQRRFTPKEIATAKKARAARTKAENAAPANPHKGMTKDQVDAIQNIDYLDPDGEFYDKSCPKMDRTLGHRTPAFVNWLYRTHPKHAYVRYAYKDIWPTE